MMRSGQEKRDFIDFSKTEEGKKIFEKNKEFWTNGNFLEHVKTLTNPQDIEMAQIMRKYQSSFMWIHKEVDSLKAFQIRHTPTVKPADLPKEIDLTEGYLWLEVIVPNNFPQEAASFVILNHSVEKDIKRLVDRELFDFHIQCRSLLKTLKNMDNNLDKLFEKAIAIKSQPAPVPVEKKEPLPNKGPLVVKMKETREREEKEKLKEKEREIERLKEQEKPKEKAPVLVQGSWTQEEQRTLEQGLVEFKDIKDAKEKWTKIAERVGKTMSECVQRFKDCRKAAEEQKNNPPEEQKVSDEKPAEEEEEEEESSEGEDSGSDEEDGEGHVSDENNEEQKVNRKIRDYQEYDSALESIVLAKSMRSENVSVGNLILLQVQVSCKDCKCIHEVEAQKEADSEYLINNDKCPRCGTKSRLVAKQEIFHDNSNAVCSLGSFTWDVRDFHFCEFDLTCAFCDTANRTKKIIAGQPVYMECKGCFKKMTFSYMALTLTAMNLNQVADDEEEGSGPNVTDIMKRIFARKSKFEFKVGLPLPNNGSCKHYGGSNRYFRFPCCGKAFACDDCHYTVEKGHEMILAKNMICGWCSSEQPVADTCKRCAKAVVKIVRKRLNETMWFNIEIGRTQFWEGGKGTRNVTAMSKKDPKKFRGLGKTISAKQKNKTEKKSKN